MDIDLLSAILTSVDVSAFLRSRDYFKLILVCKTTHNTLVDTVDLSDIDNVETWRKES